MGNMVEFDKYQGIDKVRFCIAAWNKNEDRHIPIKLENGRMTATDGHRLHEVNDLPCDAKNNGLYEVVKNNKTCVILKESEYTRFPDTDRVWPNQDKQWVVGSERAGSFIWDYPAPLWDGIHVYSALYASNHYTHIVRNMSDNTTINFNYLEALLHSGIDFKVSQYEEQGPVLFDNHECRALIMPMKL